MVQLKDCPNCKSNLPSEITTESPGFLYNVKAKVPETIPFTVSSLVIKNSPENAMLATENTTEKILHKAEFWKLHEHTPINERQRLILNKLFDGFEGKLQTSKWAKIAKTSTDTALRDIKDLVEKGILQQTDEGGRNASYELANFKLE